MIKNKFYFVDRVPLSGWLAGWLGDGNKANSVLLKIEVELKLRLSLAIFQLSLTG